MKRINRAISLLLCVIMVCCLLPVAPASAAGYEATGLRWGTNLMYQDDGTVTENPMPGTAFFYGTPNVYYNVEYYMVGQADSPVAATIAVPEADGRTSDSFFTVQDLESGSYYFVVTPVSPYDLETPLGSSMTSEPWYYAKPAGKCTAPTNVYWTWPVANFTDPGLVNGMLGIEVEFLFAKNIDETPEVVGWSWSYATYEVSKINFFEDLLEYCGGGYYYFRVRTLSTDITQRGHSDWSEMSAAYHCGTGFIDVDMGAYYAQPVLWAVEEGITTGLDTTHFGPDSTCTRGQIVTFLWRANGSPEPKSSNNPFYDVTSNDYFYKAVLWAVENGITSGMSANSFAPNEPCTRGQVATFLWRAKNKPASGGSNIFADVASGAYYYDAVLWAVKNNITQGMGDGKFAPDAPCTRGQIVTFLFRAYQ